MRPLSVAVIVIVVLLTVVITMYSLHHFWWKRRVIQLKQQRGVYEPVRVATQELVLDIVSPSKTDAVVIDGYTLQPSDRVLFFNQPDALHNGVYVHEQGKWHRAYDMCHNSDIVVGTRIYVDMGQEYQGYTFVIETLPMPQGLSSTYRGISQPFVFVPLLDQLFGRVDPEEGFVLVSNPQAVRGLEWRRPDDIWKRWNTRKVEFKVPARTQHFVPVRFSSVLKTMAKHEIVVCVGDKAYRVDVIVTSKNAIVAMSGTKVPKWLRILSGNGQQKMHVSQELREAVCAIQNNSNTEWNGFILIR